MKTSSPTNSDLIDSLSQVEASGRSGVLPLTGPWGEAQLYFTGGRLSMLAREGRAPLMERLVAAGTITSADLDHTRAARKGTGRSLGETLASESLLDKQSLMVFAETSLRDDAQALFWETASAGSFQEQKVPRGVFDPEERKLKLALPASDFIEDTEPNAEDQARWPEDQEPEAQEAEAPAQQATHDEPQRTEDEEPAQARVDEPESIAEVISEPEPSESAMHTLLAQEDAPAEAAQDDAPVEEEEKVSTSSPREASSRSSRELSPLFADLTEPQAPEPLATKPGPAYARRVPERLSEGPEPVVVLEQQLAEALEQSSIGAALECARELAGIHRDLGLHHRAANVFERVSSAAPDHWEARCELTRARVECGEPEEAVESMFEYARECAARNDVAATRRAYEEVLAIDPENEEAGGALERMAEASAAPTAQSGTLRLAVVVICASLLGFCTMVELGARKALREANQTVDESDLIEEGRYDEAIATFEQVLESYPRTLTAIDVRTRIESLEAKRD